MAKQIDITKDLYLCSPLLNKKCSKENCYINNGCCCHTVKKEYSQEYLFDYITNLQEKLDVSQTNEETYRLEMEDITKCLGLDEHTIFDEVKEYATNLQENYDKIYNENCKLREKHNITDISLLDENNKLQEENKEWQIIFDTFSKRPYAHRYLEEKKKELENDKIIGLDSEMVYKDYYDYKTRNEKAVEYITTGQFIKWGKSLYARILKDLLEILQGSEDK